MGYGDAIIATALARGLHTQGKLAAFSKDGRTIKWTGYCENVFKNNPNIARPGMERKKNIIWFKHYKGKGSVYVHKFDGRRWIWNYNFRAQPGEFFFDPSEYLNPPIAKSFIFIEPNCNPFIFLEPNVPSHRIVSSNKDWGDGKYERLGKLLVERGYNVVQCIHSDSRRKIPDAYHFPTDTFRQAMLVMSKASLVICPEGANHHAAAALGIPAIVIWGGYSPPETMGYKGQIKLTGGATEACGNGYPCDHCRKAMDNISVDEVYTAALKELN